MVDDNHLDPMLEAFLFESDQQIEQLEQAMIQTETLGSYSKEVINDIFRYMHTIKSSAAMMLFNNIASLAHSTEDLFYFIRETNPQHLDFSSLCDLVFESIDFIKLELEKIKNGDPSDNDETPFIQRINDFLDELKRLNGVELKALNQTVTTRTTQFYVSPEKTITSQSQRAYKSFIRFQENCEMENIRAYVIIHNLQDFSNDYYYIPQDITENNDSADVIKRDGFTIFFKTDESVEEMEQFFGNASYVQSYDLTPLESLDDYQVLKEQHQQTQLKQEIVEQDVKEISLNGNHQSNIISVNINKLDKLLDLVGEMVISEAMVTQNPDIKGLNLENFQKAARQLRKITGEIQDIVMSIRMVPLGPTFLKMNRIVRDMSRKLNKEINLKILGEETEVDKNIIENLGDPLMHLVRNASDHGIELPNERVAKGKERQGTITLEAKNVGNEVLVIIKDDGKGLNKDSILKKAYAGDLIMKDPSDMTDREIYNLIFLPGFSTKEQVTEFSGRGVGMDVVSNKIEQVGGSIQLESMEGEGTTIIIKIPLTLAIIDGMNIRVGKSRYTLPTTTIKESFRPKEGDVFKDPDGNEMIMIRGICYPILRLHELYNVPTKVTNFSEGIVIMIENENSKTCLFVDELIGEQQVVVKALPDYILKTKKIQGVAGCTLLGDGSISLILDVNGLIA